MGRELVGGSPRNSVVRFVLELWYENHYGGKVMAIVAAYTITYLI